MGYDIRWVIRGRVILARPERTMSPEDYIERDRILIEMLRASVPPAYIIFEVRQVKSYAIDTRKLSDNLKFAYEPNLKRVVVVGADMVAQTITKMIYADLPVRYALLDTLGEAVRYLQLEDPSLHFPPILPTDEPPS